MRSDQELHEEKQGKACCMCGYESDQRFSFQLGTGRTIPILGRGTLATEMEKQPEKGTQIYSGFKRRPFIKCE